MNISARTRSDLETFHEYHAMTARAGSLTKTDWENVRSYAVDALRGIMRDNPEQCGQYTQAIDEILAAQKRR